MPSRESAPVAIALVQRWHAFWMRPPYESQLHSTLGELRALFGIHVARIACAYDLEVEARLAGILPPEPD